MPGGVQGYDRYAYVNNNPVNGIDPTGHCPEDDAACRARLKNTLPKVGNGNDKNNGKDSRGRKDGNSLTINFRVGNEDCNSLCQQWAEAMGIGAFAVDTIAAGANAISTIIVYGSGGTLYPAWRGASIFFNAVGTVGTFAWAVQGFLTGSNYLAGEVTFNTDSHISLDKITISAGISQDTMVSGVLDLLGWLAPEPISATGVSGMGAAYDIFRNPAPSVLPYSGLPPIFNLSGSLSFP